jgi:Arc/MetJ family transcription regulator
MRVHITLSDDLVAELDRRTGLRGRSAFIASAVRHVLADEQRWEDIESGFGSIPDEGHEWDEDPSAWVAAQRYGDVGGVG